MVNTLLHGFRKIWSLTVNKIRKRSTLIREWSVLITAASSSITAFFAIFIETRIAKLDNHRAAVDRTLAMYRGLMDSKYFENALNISNEIRIEFSKHGLSNLYLAAANKIDGREDRIRVSLSRLLISVRDINTCAEFSGYWDDDSLFVQSQKFPNYSLGTCDPSTAIKMLGNTITYLYFYIRPVLYCDDHFRSNTIEVRNRDRLEIFVAEFLSIDDTSLRVFLSHENLQGAVSNNNSFDTSNSISLRLRGHFRING